MSIDMFQTRNMTEAMTQMKPAKSWLSTTFFNRVETHDARNIDIDLVKKGRRVAAYVSPMAEGRVVDSEGFTTETYTPPYTKEKKVTYAQDCLERRPGVNIYDGAQTPAARAQAKLGEDLSELNERIDRLEEVQASQLMKNSKVVVYGEGIPTATINFGRSADLLPSLSGSNLWSDYTNSDPLSDLSTWASLVAKKSGITPSVCIMGEDAMKDFLRGTKTQNLLDIRRAETGNINVSSLSDQGVQYYGQIAHPGLYVDVYTYQEWYYDELSQTEVPMIDPDQVILLNPSADFRRHYGLIEDISAGNAVTRRYAKSWITDDPSSRWVMVQSAPLLATHQVDAILTATVR